MWPFSTKESTKREKGIEERLETLERQFRALQLDWEDAYDKMRTITARFVKRAERIEQHEQQEQQENGSAGGSAIDLSRLDPVSRRIIERRQKMFPVRKEGTQ